MKELTKKILCAFRPNKIKINGYTLYLHSGFESISLNFYRRRDHNFEGLETYEADHVKLCKEIIKKGDVVIDIGANIGYYSVLFSKLVGRKGRVYAFEPLPKNFSLLLKNLKVNNCSNVSAFNCAVSSTNGIATFRYNKRYLGGGSLSYKEEHTDSFEVMTIKLDDFIKKADFVKMDIEGHEPEALKGMKNLRFDHLIIEMTHLKPEQIREINNKLKSPPVPLSSEDYYYNIKG